MPNKIFDVVNWRFEAYGGAKMGSQTSLLLVLFISQASIAHKMQYRKKCLIAAYAQDLR